jgi:hypothetical protein
MELYAWMLVSNRNAAKVKIIAKSLLTHIQRQFLFLLSPSRKAGNTKQTEIPDGYEESMKVPISVLNECGKSFLAADEKRQKASTQYFADTGIMALLCRHD